MLMISSQGDTLQSQPSMRFGRTPIFIKYDLDNNNWEAIENTAIFSSGGAGVAASQSLIDHGITHALSGRFGPNAWRALKAAGIHMLTFDENCSTVAEVIQRFKENQLTEVTDPE